MSHTTADTAFANKLAFRGGSGVVKDDNAGASSSANFFSGGLSGMDSNRNRMRLIKSAKAQEGMRFKARIKSQDEISPNQDRRSSQNASDHGSLLTKLRTGNQDLRKPI